MSGSALLYLLLSSPAQAEDTGTYRKFELTDGRIISGAVVTTNDTGFVVKNKTGTILVSYELLENMVNISQSEFETGKAQKIYTFIDSSISERSSYPISQAQTATNGIIWEDIDPKVSEVEIEACNLQTLCISNLLNAANIDSLMYLSQDNTTLYAYTFYSNVAFPTMAKQIEIDKKYPDFAEIYSLLIETLGYQTPSKPTLPLILPPDGTPVSWTNWVPLAGLPSMTARDPIGVGKSLAIAVPSALILVYMSGKATSTKSQFFFGSLTAYSAASIGANHIVADPIIKEE
jgi:hypothetical protein